MVDQYAAGAILDRLRHHVPLRSFAACEREDDGFTSREQLRRGRPFTVSCRNGLLWGATIWRDPNDGSAIYENDPVGTPTRTGRIVRLREFQRRAATNRDPLQDNRATWPTAQREIGDGLTVGSKQRKNRARIVLDARN